MTVDNGMKNCLINKLIFPSAASTVIRSNAVNKVQRSVLSTTRDGRSKLTTPVVWYESRGIGRNWFRSNSGPIFYRLRDRARYIGR